MIARTPGPAPDPPWLAVRADGGVGRGVGHVARCLALAEAWVAAGGRVTLVSGDLPGPWGERWAATGTSVVATVDEVRADAATGPDWWVVDGYDLPVAALGPLPDTARVLRIDDHGNSPADEPGQVDLLLDQNLGATPSPYTGRGADLLLGTRYALLRREVVRAASAVRPVDGPVRRVVVALGGAPTPEVAAFGREVTARLAATGLDASFLDGSADTARELPGADLVVAASGSTCWELALYARPSVLVALADNQAPLGVELARRGAATYLGRHDGMGAGQVVDAVEELVDDAALRLAHSRALARLVDGRGASRVATRMRADLLTLRLATADERRLVYELNNDPVARAASFRSDPIPWDDHVAWYAARLADPGHRLYVAWDRTGTVVGSVRFASEGDGAEIGVVVASDRRGQGWGGALIDAGTRRFFADVGAGGPSRVDASVKRANEASARSFLLADFDSAPSEDPEVLRYARTDGTGRRG